MRWRSRVFALSLGSLSPCIVRSDGVDFFSTYAGAALAAYQKELITKHDLLEIVARAESELDTLLFSGPNAEARKRERRSELESDAEQVHRLMQQQTP